MSRHLAVYEAQTEIEEPMFAPHVNRSEPALIDVEALLGHNPIDDIVRAGWQRVRHWFAAKPAASPAALSVPTRTMLAGIDEANRWRAVAYTTADLGPRWREAQRQMDYWTQQLHDAPGRRDEVARLRAVHPRSFAVVPVPSDKYLEAQFAEARRRRIEVGNLHLYILRESGIPDKEILYWQSQLSVVPEKLHAVTAETMLAAEPESQQEAAAA